MDDFTKEREIIMCARFAANVIAAYREDKKYREYLDTYFGRGLGELFSLVPFFDPAEKFVDQWYAGYENEIDH
ncbi:MAG: hypothetical protein IKS52_04275 [Clostridia bacterium]|nr:hypothetical protein [Clostridia bacterium]